MARIKYRLEEDTNAKNPTQKSVRRWPIDDAGNRIGEIERLPGGIEQYTSGVEIVSCIQDAPIETMPVVVKSEVNYNVYVELRPANNCGGASIHSTGFGMPPLTTVAMQPTEVEKKAFCLWFNTPGHSSRLVSESNVLIAQTDGNTPASVPNHIPLSLYKVLVGLEVVSFSFKNDLPVSAMLILKDCNTGTIKFQTPANGVAAGGTYTFSNIEAAEYCLEFIASGMAGRAKTAQLINANGQQLTVTNGQAAGRFPGFVPGNTQLRAIETGSVVLNDLRIADSTSSRYNANGVQEVLIFLTSTQINNIGPFDFRVKNANNNQVVAEVKDVPYDNANGYVFLMPAPFVGSARIEATAKRGTATAADDWGAIDKIITLAPNQANYISEVAFRYEGQTNSGQQFGTLLVNSTYAGTTYRWENMGAFFDSMIATSDYPGYTHYMRIFGELGRATFDVQNNIFSIKPNTSAQDTVSVSYQRNGDVPGT